MRNPVCAGLIGALAITGSLVEGQQSAPAAQPLGQVCVLEFSRCSVYGRADIDYGFQLYTAHCSGCHAPRGNGVPTVDLRSGQFRRASTDLELKGVITAGVPNTPMPPHTFSDAEFVALVAYLRNMRDVDARDVTIGDPDRGRTLFEGKGRCGSCHRVNGRGSRVAPDLSTVGLRRPAEALQRALVDPTGAMLPSNRSIRAVTNDGKLVRGRRLNEDTYTVQLIDDKERLVSLEKARLREYAVLTERKCRRMPKRSPRGSRLMSSPTCYR